MSEEKKAKKNTITASTIPEGFTVPLALADFLPVLFFGGTGILLGMISKNWLIIFSAAGMFLSGLLKVIWKIIAAVKKRNVWPLFVQMRGVMPICFMLLLVGCVHSFLEADKAAVLAAVTGMPQVLFFALGILGLIGMTVCAFRLDSADPKANRLEQTVNAAAQACFFIAMILVWLKK